MVDVKLSPAGLGRFNAFLDRYAPQYDRQAAAFEMLDIIAERHAGGERMSWEVRALDSATGRPEIFYLSDDDVIATDAGDGES